MAEKKLRLVIVTGERQVLEEDGIDMVVAPGIEGYLGILPRHAPLLTALRPGELVVKKGGEEYAYAISGGFLEVLPDQVTILADTAERSDEIDIERAEAARRRAQERLASAMTEQEIAAAKASLAKALVRIKVARRRATRRRRRPEEVSSAE